MIRLLSCSCSLAGYFFLQNIVGIWIRVFILLICWLDLARAWPLCLPNLDVNIFLTIMHQPNNGWISQSLFCSLPQTGIVVNCKTVAYCNIVIVWPWGHEISLSFFFKIIWQFQASRILISLMHYWLHVHKLLDLQIHNISEKCQELHN